MPKSQWFVIHTLSGQEQKVKENIEKRLKAEEMGEFIKEVLVPVEKVVDVRGGKKTVTSRKLHPGYVYIDMVLLDENNRIMERPWYFIQDTPGKIGIVGGDRPMAVTPDEIATIKEQITESRRDREAEGAF
jgi:transcriptional antiterminator NusG